ncbi:MAG: SRPBCC family protein [Planctomycetota bacterium]
MIELGESVTWQAKHLGVTQRLTSKITAFDRPHYFQDTMTRGAFKYFQHDHYFKSQEAGTVMVDVIDFASPFGWVGVMADRLFMARYLRRLITQRGEAIRIEAERLSHSPKQAS